MMEGMQQVGMIDSLNLRHLEVVSHVDIETGVVLEP